jgi:hypothetical protein
VRRGSDAEPFLLRGSWTATGSNRLDGGLCARGGMVDGRSAAVAEDGGGVDGVVAGVTVRDGGFVRTGSKDLGGDVHGLHGVVTADARGHEECLEDADDGGDACPEEDEIEDAETVATEIEVMDTEVAEEDGEEDADELILAGAFVFGIEPCALLVVHVRGVDGIDGVHKPSS